MNFLKQKGLSVVSLVGILFAACSDHMNNAYEDAESALPLSISAAYPSATRASDAGFEDGDQMGVFVLDYRDGEPRKINDSEAVASNVRFDFNGKDNSWTGVRNVYWKDRVTPADIIGYYPFTGEISDALEMSVSVSNHQDYSGTDTEMGGYCKSDILWGKAEKQMPSSGKTNLTLHHMMAGVRITLEKGDGFSSGEWSDADKVVVVTNTVLSGTMNLENGMVTVGNASTESIIPILNNGDYRAVLIPQNVNAGLSLISISVNGVGYSLVKQNDTEYIGGKMHTFTITVDKKPNGDYDFLVSDEAVIQWMDEAEFRDGVIRPYTTVHVPKKGTLKDIMVSENINYKELCNLKLTGEISEDDFYFMRDEMTSLRSLNLKEVKSFYGDREDMIAREAMYQKTSLLRIVFPDGLKVIGASAFHRSGLMGDLILPEGLIMVGESFDNDDFWVGSQSNGGYGAFSYCPNLMGNLELPSTLTHIEDGAFTYDEFDGPLILPKSLEYIGSYSFYGNKYTGELRFPENIRFIGSGAFGQTCFSGSLEIPQGIDVIYPHTFENVSFSGSLLLPEGITEIKNHAFEGCGFKGELALPESLLTLGDYAFSYTRISGVVFPEGLLSIGKGCFRNCAYMTEKVTIPRNVTRINEYTFAGNTLMSEIELHEDVRFVGGAAFYRNYNMKEITVRNPEPPLISIVHEWDPELGNLDLDPFANIPMANLTLKIPEGCTEAYSRAEAWKNIGRHADYNGFGCRPEKVCALNRNHQETVIIDCKGEWEVSQIPSWCSISQTAGNGKTQASVTVSGLNHGDGGRNGYIEFRMKDSGATTRCEIAQFDYRYDEDECVTLQEAVKGNGIDVLFVADGFDAESIANDDYMSLVKEQMDAFFGIEPYASYRDYFNVYACVSLSQEIGVNTTSTSKNTRFLTRFDNGSGCSVRGLACNNPDDVFEYALTHSPLTREGLHRSLIIMALNSDQYGSVTTLSESGAAIAIVGRSSDPYPFDTRGMIQHEACGHAFGKLAEERIVQNRYIKDEEKYSINEGFWRGWYQNISLTGKLNEVSWSDFIFDPRYSNKVDVFEGGYGVTRGVYRAEINSCMNYGIPYFSAPARLDIMRRILEYSGEGFTMEKFYATDSDKWGATGSTRAAMPDASDAYVNSGMHHPVRIVKSKKY